MSQPQDPSHRNYPRNPLAGQITDQEFQLWRRHPITEMVHLFLLHQVQNWRQAAMELFEEGVLKGEMADRLRYQINAAEELRGITVNSIRSYYEQEASKSSQTNDRKPTASAD